ncbi:CopG family antitoxin [Baaleninema sp.]|uniref:CopG family antitoxin n=1 Tax=Baaleninema sp. TaxID=3101197 RepID=UPI003D093D41
MTRETIPQTDSIQELAEFWETHDLTDFEDQLEEVEETVFDRSSFIQIQLQPQEIEAIEKIARSRNLSSTDLIREWVLEKVRTA